MNGLLARTGERIAGGLWHRRAPARGTAAGPLLDQHQLLEIASWARSMPGSLFEFRHPSAAPLLGDALSPFRGQGLEFEENRNYQPGDEARLINWRLYARSGRLYTRVYTEERRPELYLLVDRRAAMRFATRRQLKARLAASIAACHIYQASHQAIAAGGLVLDDTLHWSDPGPGPATVESLVRQIAAPCPPTAFDARQSRLGDALRMLAQRSRSGGYLLLVSDFADFDPPTMVPLLHRLAQQHVVRALEILDPVELRLPRSGEYLVDTGGSNQPIRIPDKDNALREEYATAVANRRAQLSAAFAACNIMLTGCLTTDDYRDCLVGNHVQRQHR